MSPNWCLPESTQQHSFIALIERPVVNPPLLLKNQLAMFRLKSDLSGCKKSKKIVLPVFKMSSDLVSPHFSLLDRKSTRLNSSHVAISYAVFCLKKKTIKQIT